MKKLSTMIVLALFLLEGTGQIMNGVGQVLSGPFNAINPQVASASADRWVGHQAFMAEGTDPSGMSSTG